MAERCLVEAVNDALHVELARDESVMVMGEDVAASLNLPAAKILATIERHNAFGDDPVQVRGGWAVDIDELYAQQAVELDKAKRTEQLNRAQQLIHEKSMYAPIWQLAFLNGVGKRVGESGLGLIKGHAYSAPYEDVTIKKG